MKNRALVAEPLAKVPADLMFLFNDPPLVGEEKREDYESLLAAVVAAIRPRDAIVWLLAGNFADLSWEIRREKRLKLRVVKIAEAEAVSGLLSLSKPSPFGELGIAMASGRMDDVARQWFSNGEARQKLELKLAKQGYDASYISTLTLKRAARQIEAIDRRIYNCEMRRASVLKTIEQYSEASARRLAASTDIIEGEFTEAAE